PSASPVSDLVPTVHWNRRVRTGLRALRNAFQRHRRWNETVKEKHILENNKMVWSDWKGTATPCDF
ncbi:hypothetical protein GGP41_002700, partial [Bipolaris sorokiniana]